MIYKRGTWFWADFSVNGVRYRVPLKDTKGRRIAARLQRRNEGK